MTAVGDPEGGGGEAGHMKKGAYALSLHFASTCGGWLEEIITGDAYARSVLSKSKAVPFCFSVGVWFLRRASCVDSKQRKGKPRCERRSSKGLQWLLGSYKHQGERLPLVLLLWISVM